MWWPRAHSGPGCPALIILVYAAAVYLFFLAVLGYAVGFFAGFGVPKGIDQGPRAAVLVAVAIDLLLLLFAVRLTRAGRRRPSVCGRPDPSTLRRFCDEH